MSYLIFNQRDRQTTVSCPATDLPSADGAQRNGGQVMLVIHNVRTGENGKYNLRRNLMYGPVPQLAEFPQSR
jgi:hypothetical protein